jgi:imidazolonepropionase-like amidohydrolase
VFLPLIAGCSSPQEADLILTNITIVDIERGELIPDQFIAINGNRILAVGDATNLSNYQSEIVLSLQDKYVMPGLWDNHVHFRGGEQLADQNKAMLPLFLTHGVTTVRDGGGDITPHVQAWNTEIKNGSLHGPTIFTPGPKLDGSNPAWDGSIKVIERKDVIEALDSLDRINADFVKIYDGNLSADMYYAIITEAEKRGLMVTGHMPLDADLMRAVSLGLDGTEHLYYALTVASPLGDSLREAAAGYRMISPLINSFDSVLADQQFRKMAAAEFYITPTLHIGKVLGELNIADHSNDELLRYMEAEIVQTYQRRINSANRGGDQYTAQRQRWSEGFRRLIKPIQLSGIHILAGSDAGPFNSYVYPGESLHKELEMLVMSGLTPQQALASSVINGPQFFNLLNKYGSVATGKVADLLILDANPLEDISNTTKINAVIKAGNYYNQSALERILASLHN